MITKAIVEEVLSPYKVKIRIPLFDRAESTALATDTKNLNTATICSLPNCYTNVQVGDVVFVGFEDNTYYKAVILGHLCCSAASNSYADATFGSLTAVRNAVMPKDTTIGNITSSEISCLSGVSENIQKQINDLKDQINLISQLQQGGSY